MNTFEVAVLRVLVKRHTALKLSTLVSGFPDNCEDYVLAAVSSLKLRGYIMLFDYQPSAHVLIAKDRRKEILQIIGSNIHSDEPDVLPADHISEEKKNTRAAKPLSQIKAVAVASLIALGLFALLTLSMPATSTDTEFVVHQDNSPLHWNAYGTSDRDDLQSSVTDHPHISSVFGHNLWLQRQQT